MQTILGSNGVIGKYLAKDLYNTYTKNIRLVSRNPIKVNETDTLFSANLLNPVETEAAVKGSSVVYLTVGLPNDTKVWQEDFPLIMNNVIQACVKHQANLVFFDNTYMYGVPKGIMTEDTEFSPVGPKEKVRAEISNMLLKEIQAKKITALIARAPEFYGLSDTSSITNGLVFRNLGKDRRIKLFLTDEVFRTLIFSEDAARATALLGNTPEAYHQTWHLPCDDKKITYKSLIALLEDMTHQSIPYDVLSFSEIEDRAKTNKNMYEVLELLPRYDKDFIFDSSKFKLAFPHFKWTSYEEGLYLILKEMKKKD